MVAVWLSTNTVTSAKLIYVEPGYHRNGWPSNKVSTKKNKLGTFLFGEGSKGSYGGQRTNFRGNWLRYYAYRNMINAKKCLLDFLVGEEDKKHTWIAAATPYSDNK